MAWPFAGAHGVRWRRADLWTWIAGIGQGPPRPGQQGAREMRAPNAAARSAIGSLRRHARNSTATAEAILAAATTEFATHGFGGGRVDRIAARAGVNKRMIYHHFGHKR